jgi:hypothetical protein
MVRLMVQVFAETTYERAFYQVELAARTEKGVFREGKKLAAALAATLEGRTITSGVMLTENAQRAAYGSVIQSNYR